MTETAGAPAPAPAASPPTGRAAALLGRLGWSEGDAWTVGIGMSLALVLAVTTVPASLRDRPVTAAAAALPAGEAPAAEPVLPAAPAPAADAGSGVESLLGPLGPSAPLPPAPAPLALPDAAGAPAFPLPADPGPAAPAAPAVPAPVEPAPEVREVRVLAPVAAPGTAGGITVGAGSRVHTATDAPGDADAPSQLLTYATSGSLEATTTVPEQPAGRARGVTALATAADGTLLATDAATARVLRFDPSSRRWSVRAVVPDLPPCLLPGRDGCQPGPVDTTPLLSGIAVAPDGTAYVADAGQGTVFVLRPGRPAEPWWSADDVRGEQGLAGLDVDAGGDVLAAVGRLGDPLGRDVGGALLRIASEDDGSAGARSTVAAFPAGQRPSDVAGTPSGTTYVTVRGEPALVVLDRGGSELLRITDDALADPTGLHVLPGRALVAVGGPRKAIVEVDLRGR